MACPAEVTEENLFSGLIHNYVFRLKISHYEILIVHMANGIDYLVENRCYF